jgi:hypothetical protein
MKKWILALTAIVMVPLIGSAQSKEMLFGTWRLVSESNVTDKGIVKKEVFGRKPTGLLTYTPDGRMMVIAANDVRKPLTLADWFAGPVENRALAFSTFFAYAGRYTLSGNTVTHHIEVAWIQGWANTDQVRRIHLQGDQLVLRTTTPFQQDGAVYAYQELTWDRVK